MSEYKVKPAHNREGTPCGFYWVLEASNGEVVATSEVYTRKVDAERGAADAANASKEALDG